MAYTIQKADGTILLTLADGTVNQAATSISLIGKNVNAYGQYYNNNLIAMLENFASETPPRAPLEGQLWYSRNDGRLYVFDQQSLRKPVGGAILYPSTPPSFSQGDLWINTLNSLLSYTPDGVNWITLSTATTATSKLQVDRIIDSNNNTQTVASIYNNNVLIAVASSSSFTFQSAFNGMTSVSTGLNLNTSIPNIRFIGTATSADASVVYFYNTVSNVLLATTSVAQVTTAKLTIGNDAGLLIGSSANFSFTATGVTGHITGLGDITGVSNSTINIRTNRTSGSPVGPISNILLNPSDGSYSNYPTINFFSGVNTTTLVKVNGNFTVGGNSIFSQNVNVTGNVGVSSTATVNNLNVNSNTVYLSYNNPTLIEGGGMVLAGTDAKYITYTGSYSGAWQVNSNFNLISNTSSYLINGTSVINSSSLGFGITSAPSVDNLGVLKYLTVTNVSITSGTIAIAAPVGANVDLNINPAGVGTVDVGGHKVTSVATCTNNLDAANKIYVDNLFHLVGTKGFAVTLDITSFGPNENSLTQNYVSLLFPVSNPGLPEYDLVDGTRIKVLCYKTTITVPTTTLSLSKTQVNIGGQSVLADVAGTFPVTTLPVANVSITYVKVKQYTVTGGVWVWDNVDVTL